MVAFPVACLHGNSVCSQVFFFFLLHGPGWGENGHTVGKRLLKWPQEARASLDGALLPAEGTMKC